MNALDYPVTVNPVALRANAVAALGNAENPEILLARGDPRGGAGEERRISVPPTASLRAILARQPNSTGCFRGESISTRLP